MKTIYKYEMPIVDTFCLSLPKDAQILTFQNQRGEPCIWVEVKTENSLEERTFRVFGTGHEIPENLHLTFIGTIQQETLRLVWHLFEQKYNERLLS